MSAGPRLWSGPDGTTWIAVRAQPGARRSGVVGLWNDHLKVAVRAPADEGRANEELLEVLAAALGLRSSALRLAKGAQSRQKEFAVALPLEETRRRLLAALGSA